VNWSPPQLEQVASDVAHRAAELVASRVGQARALHTKSSVTDIVTQTDVDAEAFIRNALLRATPGCGFVGEEGGTHNTKAELQWIIDPLDGTVNFTYEIPAFAVSVAAAMGGRFVAGAVVDALRGEVFSAHLGGGARCDGSPIAVSGLVDTGGALVGTGFSYTARLRSLQGAVVQQLLPMVRDIRCFGSAALNLCWVANGRLDAYFERDIKLWDWAAGALIAEEAGAQIELPCPENSDLVLASTPGVFGDLRGAVNPWSSTEP
jgi:myo-inositol-1(or 4)-monophosphatase